MQSLLDEISVIPGVAAACIFTRSRGIVCRQTNVALARDITDSIGFNFIRLLQMASMNKLDIKSVQFRFDRYWLIGTALHKGIVLLTVCDLQANCSLVSTTAAMLADDMREKLEQLSAVQPKSTEEQFFRHKEGQPDKDEEVSQQCLLEVENALAAAIGPVAKMIMSDHVHKWKTGGPSALSRLPELLELLAEEIEDPALIAEFRAKLQHLW